MPSNALEGLTDRLKDVDQLMEAHAAREGTQRGRRFDVEGLNRAAILLLSAHLEGYLEDLVAEALHAINAELNPKRVNAGFANPSPDRIDDLFEFLGISKLTSQVSWRKASNASVKKALRDLVDMRNRIAHGALGVTVYKRDVTRYRSYVTGFAERVDEVVRQRVEGITGDGAPW